MPSSLYSFSVPPFVTYLFPLFSSSFLRYRPGKREGKSKRGLQAPKEERKEARAGAPFLLHLFLPSLTENGISSESTDSGAEKRSRKGKKERRRREDLISLFLFLVFFYSTLLLLFSPLLCSISSLSYPSIPPPSEQGSLSARVNGELHITNNRT